MKLFQDRRWMIAAGLILAMAATRYNHFGSAVSLPDASFAVFFLCGLYLARFARASIVVFTVLLLEAGLVDYYATSVQGISDWCMTPAYWFLIPTYGSLWFAGHWFATRFAMEGKGLIGLALTAGVASSFAFLFSNAGFYLFSGRFNDMTAIEYASRVAQYYVSYVSVALLYVACAVAIHMVFNIISKESAHSPPDVA
ncbi:MAG: hypothetical protein KGJ19_06490 [Betaproteobacteria bacterium]|nr:hypothetical protein [Betaproteobacteria bacterium]